MNDADGVAGLFVEGRCGSCGTGMEKLNTFKLETFPKRVIQTSQKELNITPFKLISVLTNNQGCSIRFVSEMKRSYWDTPN